ncbi:uncharacterized protein PG998_011850 [Apiospora kogelbergensis]|uniref:uncharacterized protein n=1 Tax=Apiospora kogelbergensis TaxID=1337665 RepID=UPI00312EECDD
MAPMMPLFFNDKALLTVDFSACAASIVRMVFGRRRLADPVYTNSTDTLPSHQALQLSYLVLVSHTRAEELFVAIEVELTQ